jgi:hypothetical protein
MMATTNRASLSDPYLTPPVSDALRDTFRADAETPRRTAMVVGGFFLALVSLAIGSLALVQVWLAPSSTPAAGAAPALQSWEATAMIIAGGVGFAAGAALVGIGMGRWTSPRPPESEADYTGPGDTHDTAQPPRVV